MTNIYNVIQYLSDLVLVPRIVRLDCCWLRAAAETSTGDGIPASLSFLLMPV